MSVYLVINDNAPHQLSSVKGWGDFTRWVEGLGESKYGNLTDLVIFGWSQKSASVYDELFKAKKPESKDTSDIVGNLLSLMYS